MADNNDSNNKNDTLFNKLKKMFSSDVIVRNVGGKKLKIVDSDSVEFATDRNSLRDRYNRLRSSTYNLHNRDMSLAYQAARLELFRDYDCVGEDTIIPLPDGSRPTIKELAEKYKDTPSERFHVFSYDHSTNSVKLGNAYHPRKKAGGARKCWKVTLDDGKYVVGSAGHPFLMRTGEYKKLEDITVGESVMPFYQKDFYKNGYRSIYNFSRGWQSEHVIVAEQFERILSENEVVHHKDFDKTNNLPDNLVIMNDSDHRAYHCKINNEKIWSPENREKQIAAIRRATPYKNIHHWNGERAGENNPFFGKTHTDASNEKRSKSLKLVYKDVDTSGTSNPNYRDELTIETLKVKAIEHYKQRGKLTSWGLVEDIGCDYSVLQNRLKSNKTDWKSFKNEIESTLNHKIVSIEYIGEKDVYDVTVEKYQNFACDSCFLHNTMDQDPILASALDVYSEECVTPNEFGNILTISSTDENIKKILENLFNDILNVEYNLHSWTRSLAKYGDFFLRMDISPEYGVYLVKPMSAYEITRVEGSDPQNINYVKFQHDGLGGGQEYENFEMAHFRLMSDSNFLPYGKSMLEPARRIWKQLSLMEDAMLIHRIVRAPEKRIFKVDVGNIPPSEVDGYIEKLMTKTKKVPYIDERTGDYNLRYNLNNMLEDFWLPVRGGDSGTSIDTLSGMEFTGIEDIEYLRNKMMAALKIPKAFLGYDEAVGGKSTLSMEDVRFARTIGRMQRIIVSELSKIAVVHLFVQGYKDASLVDFELKLSNPSTVFEQEKIAIWQDKVNLAKDMMESNSFSRKWLYTKLWGMSEDEAEELKVEIINDKKQEWRIEQITAEGNDPMTSNQKVGEDGELSDTGGGDSGGGDIGGDLPDLGGDTGGDTGGDAMPDLPELTESEEPELIESTESEEKEPATREEKDERNRNRDQTGDKKNSNYAHRHPFGEDPLGKKHVHGEETRRRPIRTTNPHPLRVNERASRITLSSMSEELKSIKQTLRQRNMVKSQKSVISETTSMLDESNLMDDNNTRE